MWTVRSRAAADASGWKWSDNNASQCGTLILSVAISATFYSQHLFSEMATLSQISQRKRVRDEYLNSGLPSPDAKRSNSGMLGHDCNLIAVLHKINSADNINRNQEDTNTIMNNVEGQMKLNVAIDYLEDKIGLKAQTDNNIKPSDENISTEQMGELSAEGDSGTSLVTFDIENFPYCDDACGEYDFFVDHFTPAQHGILQNHIYGDFMYADAMNVYAETELFCGSLWEDDIWH